MTSEKKALMQQIEQEQGDLSSFQSDLAKITDEKGSKEDELAKTQKVLADLENKRNGMIDDKRRFEGDLSSFRKDIDDMEMTIQRVDLVGSEKQPLKYKIKAWRVQIKV